MSTSRVDMPLVFLGSVALSLSIPLTARKHTVPKASKYPLALPCFPSNAVALFTGAHKARNSTDGNYVLCTPAFFFTMLVVDVRH